MNTGENQASEGSPALCEPPRSTRGHELSGWRSPAFWMLSRCIQVWNRTLRLRVPKTDRFEDIHSQSPVVILLWHNRLFAVPLLISRLWTHRKVSALVSASRDGGMFSKFIGYVGLPAIRGSSSRFGREAFAEMIAANRAGYDIAITPDGPRGPAYKMKAGALLAARRARAPIVLVGVRYDKFWRMKSWDQFRIPKPFSSVEVRFRIYNLETLPEGNEGLAELENGLLELNGETPVQ